MSKRFSKSIISSVVLGGLASAVLTEPAAARKMNACQGGGSVKTTMAGTAAANGYRPPPVVRDHRQNPQPWSLPRHYHRH